MRKLIGLMVAFIFFASCASISRQESEEEKQANIGKRSELLETINQKKYLGGFWW